MKKLSILALSLCMILALAACGSQSNEPASDGQESSASAVSGNQDNERTDTSNTNVPSGGNDASEETTDGKVLVAYFSCTGNTKGLAEKIASAIDADFYELVPEEPYTDADLNYNDSSTRATVEQNDPNARPAISGSVDNMEQYDVIFLGYPIWWGQAPKIISTFLESYNLSGKTIVPFCTSGSSPVGSSATNLYSSAQDADWLDGTRFSASASDSDIESWLNDIGLK